VEDPFKGGQCPPMPELSLVEGHDKGQILSSLKRSERGKSSETVSLRVASVPTLPELSLVEGHDKGQILSSLKGSKGGNLLRLSL
jgi:hypothetical protein